jgi:hypothetical protein
MIRRVKRLLRRSVRACVRLVRPVAQDTEAVERHLDSLIREISRLHIRMERLEELIQQTHPGITPPGDRDGRAESADDAPRTRAA